MKTTATPLLLGLLALSAPAAERPNLLMICIDDLNDWVGCLGGHPDAITPNLDALAARGRNFTNAHCSVTVCSPSRVSVMSGLHATTHGSYELGPAYQEIKRLDDVPCLQEYFQGHGYTTMAGGKVLHHGFTGRLAGAIDRSFGGRAKGGPRPKEPGEWGKGAWDWGAFPEGDAEMYDLQIAEAGAEILGENHDAPFFLSVGIFRPHVPLFVPQKWYDLYDPETLRLPEAPPEDMADVPPNFQYKMGVAPTFQELKDAGKWRSLVHAYLASVSFADHCVGILLEGLEKGPNREDTLVVLWSDHGFHLGEKQHIAKRTLWEESTRVPLLFAGPGIGTEQGSNCREPASLLDIYPTLLELCGLPRNLQLEGLSLVPQLEDPTTPRERPALSTSYFDNHSLRSRDWRYIRYADGAEELYDHRKDPGEQSNLAGNPEHRAVIESLSRWIPEKAAPEVKPLAKQEQHLRKPRSKEEKPSRP